MEAEAGACCCPGDSTGGRVSRGEGSLDCGADGERASGWRCRGVLREVGEVGPGEELGEVAAVRCEAEGTGCEWLRSMKRAAGLVSLREAAPKWHTEAVPKCGPGEVAEVVTCRDAAPGWSLGSMKEEDEGRGSEGG